jgi:hypothetical protein
MGEREWDREIETRKELGLFQKEIDECCVVYSMIF